MRPLRDIPIKQKLVMIVMATTTMALLLAGIGIVVTDSLLFRGYLSRDLSALSRIIADNSTAALAFNDPASAAETLSALRARPHVVSACIYRRNGSTLARYLRGPNTSCPAFDTHNGIRFAAASVTVSQPILLTGRRIGNLMLLYELGEITERTKLYSGVVFGVSLASSLLALLLSSRLRAVVATPVSQLVKAMALVSQTGDYSTRAPTPSSDELGVLAHRFNEMLAGIQSRDDALREERERFRFMAESMPQKIFTAAADGNIDYYNRQWMEFTGLSFEQIKNWGWTEFVHPDDVEENVRIWQESLASGTPCTFEHRFRRRDGKYRWHLSRAHPMRDDSGKISMWIGSNTDIHEQKEKEEALRRANEDLRQFAYSASHDLQEPIRNVGVYSEIVSRRYRAVLDPDGQQFLGFLTEGSRRLATLVSDLLAYTTTSMAELGETSVDAEEILQRSLDSLAEAIRQNEAVVTHDPLPSVHVGEAHLQQVLQNLIGNALKYRKEEPPRIHVSAASQGSRWCFSVRDNGIGIDAKYKEKIFGIFKRLHHDPKFAGTGIGLAICHRVVQRYGGQIWVESELGRGSTFSFTIPKHPHPLSVSAADEDSAGMQADTW